MVILEALDANINSFYVMHLSLVTIPVVLLSMIVFMNANGASLVLLIKILKTKKKSCHKTRLLFCPWKRSHIFISFVKQCFV